MGCGISELRRFSEIQKLGGLHPRINAEQLSSKDIVRFSLYIPLAYATLNLSLLLFFHPPDICTHGVWFANQ